MLFATQSPSFFPSVIFGVALVETLLELLVVEVGESAVQNLEQAEQQFYTVGVYLQCSSHPGS